MLKISQRIKHYRQKKGLTQEDVANALGIRRENYIKYESGERNPKDERLIELAKKLDVSCNTLREGVEREFADLLHRHIRGAVMGDVEGCYAFYSDVIEDEVFKDISAFFTLWHEKFEYEAKQFFEHFMLDPSLKLLIDLRELHMYLEEENKQIKTLEYEMEFEAEPSLEDEVKYRLAFCIAMTKYLSEKDYDIILEEAGRTMTGTDISPLQYFAVKVFVPFLSYIADTVEMTMWNTTIDDFEILFLHGALTEFDKESFDDNDEGDE